MNCLVILTILHSSLVSIFLVIFTIFPSYCCDVDCKTCSWINCLVILTILHSSLVSILLLSFTISPSCSVSDPVPLPLEPLPALLRPKPVRSQSLVEKSSPSKFVKPKVLKSLSCTLYCIHVRSSQEILYSIRKIIDNKHENLT